MYTIMSSTVCSSCSLIATCELAELNDFVCTNDVTLKGLGLQRNIGGNLKS